MAVRKKQSDTPPFTTRAGMWLSGMALMLFAGILHALPMTIVLGGTVAGGVCLWQTAMADERFLIAGDTLSLDGSVDFCDEAVTEVELLGRAAAGRSLLDPWLLSDLRNEYAQSPWVKRVHALRRVFPNRVAVEFVLRNPALQVRREGYHWLVDDEGVLLRVRGRRTPFPDVPVLIGATSDAVGRRPKASGRTWTDPAVTDALGLLRALRASPLSEDLHIRRILAHGGLFRDTQGNLIRKRARLDLETELGAVVRWGTFNSVDSPDEMLTSEKLSLLRSLVARDFARVPGVALDVRTRVAGFSLPEE